MSLLYPHHVYTVISRETGDIPVVVDFDYSMGPDGPEVGPDKPEVIIGDVWRAGKRAGERFAVIDADLDHLFEVCSRCAILKHSAADSSVAE
jgi:hypothetical protein